MPDLHENAKGAVKWLVDKLLKDLQVAKVLPIKMASMKHQDVLRFLALELLHSSCIYSAKGSVNCPIIDGYP